MSTRRLFDAIVLGGHVGPLVAACVLARRGYKVLHVEHDGLSGGYEDGGFQLPLEPELLPGPRSSPAIEAALEALALGADAQRLLRPIEPGIQILVPGRRFDLPHEKAARGRELEREFGAAEGAELQAALGGLIDAYQAVNPFLAALPPLPPGGLLERHATAKAARGLGVNDPPPLLPQSHPLGAAVAILARLSTYLWAPQPTGLHALRASGRLLLGVHRYAEAGKPTSGYARLLRRRLKDLGGELAGTGGAVAEEITIEKGRVQGLRVQGDHTDYRCRFLVCGIDAAALRRLIPLEGRRRRFDSTLGSVRPREMLFSTNLVLNRRGWPAGLGESAVYLKAPGGPLEEEHALVLQRFEAHGPSGPDPERVVLQVSCFMAAARRDLGDAWIEGLQGRVLDTLRGDLMPFLDRHVELVSSPYLARLGPARGARLTPHPLLETDLKPAWGVAVLQPRTPYKNLVLAGREVVPGLGMEGEFLGGMRAADLVAGAARRHDPLKDQ